MAELHSNPVPFEIIEDAEIVDREGIELTAFSFDDPYKPLSVIPRRDDLKILDEIEGSGGGSFQVFRDDPKLQEIPNILSYQNIYKYSLDGKVIGAFLGTRKKTEFVSRNEQAAETIVVSGEGLRGWFRNAVVEPYRGIKSDSSDTRFFSFASERGSWYKPVDWIVPALIQQHSLDANLGPFNTAPAEWPDAPDAYWIWGEPNSGVDPAPEGMNYFRHEFEVTGVTGQADYAVFVAAKDHFQVFIDGQQIIEAEEDDAYAKTWRADFKLGNGSHVLAVRVLTQGLGAAGMIAALFKSGDATSEIPATLLSVTNDVDWVVNPYPDPAPGWSPGEVMLTLLSEADARGVRFPDWLIPTFTAETDSDGVPWPRSLDWAFQIGTEYYDVVEKLEELSCDLWINPETYELNMWIERGTIRNVQTDVIEPVKFEIAKNITKADSDGESEIKNTLLLSTDDGWETISDGVSNSVSKYGRIEGYVATGSSKSVASDLAQRIFALRAQPTESATYDIIDVDGARPHFDFFVGDWVLAPDPDQEYELTTRRVMSISVTEDRESGVPQFACEFDTIREDLEKRFDRWLRTTSDGTLGGTLANVSSSGGGSGTPGNQTIQRGPVGQEGPRGLPGFYYKGPWDALEEYYAADVVYFDSKFWIASKTTTTMPNSVTDDWEELNVSPQAAPMAAIALTRTTTFSLPTALTAIPWTQEIFKAVLQHDTDSSKIVITDSGPYHFHAKLRTTITSSGTRDFFLYVNGILNSTAKTVRSSESATIGIAEFPGRPLTLAVGDEIEIRTSGSAASTLEVADGVTWVSLSSVKGTTGPRGPIGLTGPSGTITSATAVKLGAGSNPTVTLGGTPSARTMEFGLPEGEVGPVGPSGTITDATAIALSPGDSPSVTLGGTPSARTMEFGIPTGAQGVQGPPGDPLRFRGPWDSGTVYEQSDAVEHNGSVWVTAITSVNKEPGVDPDWVEIASKGGSGGGGGFAASNYVLTTPVLSDQDMLEGLYVMSAAEVHQALAVASDRAVRIQFYATEAQRAADISRLPGMDPHGNHGVLLDLVLPAGQLTQILSPAAVLFAAVGYGPVPFRITNLSGSASTVTVTVTAKGLPGTAHGGTDAATYVKTTASMANGANEQSLYTLSSAEVHYALSITADKASRVRFYATAAARSADVARPKGTDPTGNHGVLLDVSFVPGELTKILTPSALLMALGTFGAVPVTITNESGSAAAVTVELTAKGV